MIQISLKTSDGAFLAFWATGPCFAGFSVATSNIMVFSDFEATRNNLKLNEKISTSSATAKRRHFVQE